ncbi:hypothetical protein CRYUN_Cryun05aG0263100 [Craigia yunnanensis]
MLRASALILNTFDELERPMLSKLSSFFSKIYTIGPLHGLSNVRIKDDSSPLASTKSIKWKEDKGCITWLDSQSSKSVVFVSFGSIVSFTHDQMLEFWHGFVNSGKPFLWVIRPNSIIGEDDPGKILMDLEERTKGKGLIVSWTPQEEVLAHPAVGGFLTHSGWNSTLESIYARVPMICWPAISDQQVNSRCVSDVWRVGLDMKDSCERSVVEKMVRDLIEDNDMDQKVGSVPGMQHDHPYSFGLKQLEDLNFQFFVSETQATTRASAAIFNTFDSLEAPVLSQIIPLLPKVYTIGPLHSLWKARLGHLSKLSSSNGNLREADQNCITWLDSQPLRSVVYVSFGSYVVLTSEELLEFWRGLVNSGKRFLWTLTPDITARARDHNNMIARELDLGLRTKEKGCIVDWAPQEEVLAHPLVGGFLSHCGCNSTLESMVAGVPMICCPKLPDQFVNTRWISEAWKIGLDMKA